MRRIELAIGADRFQGTLLEQEAPRTCEAFWSLLPFEGELRHSHFIGSALTAEFPLAGMPPENPYALSIPSGAVLLDIRQQPVVINGARLPPELVIVYGTGARMLNWAGFSPANCFARISEGLERLAEVGRRLATAGFTTIRVRQAA